MSGVQTAAQRRDNNHRTTPAVHSHQPEAVTFRWKNGTGTAHGFIIARFLNGFDWRSSALGMRPGATGAQCEVFGGESKVSLAPNTQR